MGFIMDGLDAESYDRQYKDNDLVKRILQYFRPEFGRMALVAVTVLLTSGFETLLPIIISRTLDDLQGGIEARDLLIAAGLITIIASTAWFFNVIRRWFSSIAVGNVVLKLREDAFDAVMERDLSFYDTIPSGKVVSRVTSDTSAFTQVVILTTDLLSQILLVVILIGYLFTINVGLTFILLALAPFIVFVALQFRRLARKTVTQSRRVLAEVSSHIQETVSGISVAKTFRQEHAIYEEFKEVNRRAFWINLRTGYTFGSIFPILQIFAGIGTAALVYFGGTRAIDGDLTAGEWYLFIQGLLIFWFPLTSIASFWSQFQLGLAAGERVFALIDAEPKVVQTGNDRPKDINGEIIFENVKFSYKEDELVLPAFSLHIKPGETIALVGHTGAGKSSITKLVARFYEFQDGRILIDGKDIRSFNLQAYRQHIGFVTQSPFLFDGTVMENIRYGAPDASTQDVVNVAMKIGGGDWLKGLPLALQTQVGERGSSLSMGQRQLVALARVLLQAPSILILDEATANIDPLTETLIQEGLETVLSGRTAIVIAHRLSTVKNADRIIVMKAGGIIESGSHNELLDQGGHYAELYNTYFRHQSLEYIENARLLASA